jgi:hypothetical protein
MNGRHCNLGVMNSISRCSTLLLAVMAWSCGSSASLAQAVAKLPDCPGEHSPERRTAIELAHRHFMSFWLAGDGRWYSAYALGAEMRNPLAPKVADDDGAATGPVAGMIVARGLACAAFDLEPGEIFVVRYHTPIWRFNEGKGWSEVRRDQARGGQLMEVLVKKLPDGKFDLHDNLEGRRALPEAAQQRKPTEIEVDTVIAATFTALKMTRTPPRR